MRALGDKGAVSMRRTIEVDGEYRSLELEGGGAVASRPISMEYWTKVVASCDMIKWNGSVSGVRPVRRSRSTRRRNSERQSVAWHVRRTRKAGQVQTYRQTQTGQTDTNRTDRRKHDRQTQSEQTDADRSQTRRQHQVETDKQRHRQNDHRTTKITICSRRRRIDETTNCR